jgi:hypothetical protein
VNAQKLFLNLQLVSGGEAVVYEFPANASDDLKALCQAIRDAWTSRKPIPIQNPAGSQYVNSAHVAMFSVS